MNLNIASFDQLRQIIRIEVNRAQLITDERNRRPFASINQLELPISGIGPARMADIRAEGLACA